MYERKDQDTTRRIADLAREILSGATDVLEASLEMHRLRFKIGADDRDEDFDAFTVVVSETDSLPIGRQREFWAHEALQRKEPELRQARVWALSTIGAPCRNLIARFGG